MRLARLLSLCLLAFGMGACATQEPPAMPSSAQLEHRASRDLGCPGRDVRVEVASTNAHAEVQGCGRRVLYAVTCTEGGRDCAWHPLDTP
jgi:hypothetical protein